MEVWETGFPRYWTRILLPQANACYDKNNSKQTAKQTGIKLVDLLSAFFVLAVGTAVASFTFAAELLAYNFRTTKSF